MDTNQSTLALASAARGTRISAELEVEGSHQNVLKARLAQLHRSINSPSSFFSHFPPYLLPILRIMCSLQVYTSKPPEKQLNEEGTVAFLWPFDELSSPAMSTEFLDLIVFDYDNVLDTAHLNHWEDALNLEEGESLCDMNWATTPDSLYADHIDMEPIDVSELMACFTTFSEPEILASLPAPENDQADDRPDACASDADEDPAGAISALQESKPLSSHPDQSSPTSDADPLVDGPLKLLSNTPKPPPEQPIIIDLTGEADDDSSTTPRKRHLEQADDLCKRMKLDEDSATEIDFYHGLSSHIRVQSVRRQNDDGDSWYHWSRRSSLWNGSGGPRSTLKHLCKKEMWPRLAVTIQVNGQGLSLELCWDSQLKVFVVEDQVTDENLHLRGGMVESMLLRPWESRVVDWTSLVE